MAALRSKYWLPLLFRLPRKSVTLRLYLSVNIFQVSEPYTSVVLAFENRPAPGVPASPELLPGYWYVITPTSYENMELIASRNPPYRSTSRPPLVAPLKSRTQRT